MVWKRFSLAAVLLLLFALSFAASTDSFRVETAYAQQIGGSEGGREDVEAADQLVSLTLTPFNPPISIPAGGGEFQFAIEVENLRSGQSTFEIWTTLTRPDGSVLIPAAGPFKSQVPAGWSVSKEDLSQAIPGSDPAGEYTYTAYAGRYPDHVLDSGSFTFDKLAGGGWFEQSSGTDRWLFAVDFADASNGWAVGQTNKIVHTTNGGSVWTQQSIPVSSNLLSIFALNAQQAWAGGDLGRLVRTDDGGDTWVAVDTGVPGSYRWEGVFFHDENNGWVVGGKPLDFTSARRVILHTADGGATWQAQYSQSGEFPLKAVHFVDADNGWAVGEGPGILHTSNGGATWVQQDSGVGGWLYDVHFTNANNGWAVGRDGRVVHTTDGGATWVPQTTGITEDLNSLHFVDANHGWLTGYDSSLQQATIYHTSNGGMTWNTQDIPDASFLADIVFSDLTQGWAVGDNGRILHTDTGGN